MSAERSFFSRRAIRRHLGRQARRRSSNWKGGSVSITSAPGKIGRIVNDLRQGKISPKTFRPFEKNDK